MPEGRARNDHLIGHSMYTLNRTRLRSNWVSMQQTDCCEQLHGNRVQRRRVNAPLAATYVRAVARHRTRRLIENRYPDTVRAWSSQIFARGMRGRGAIATGHLALQSSDSFPSL